MGAQFRAGCTATGARQEVPWCLFLSRRSISRRKYTRWRCSHHLVAAGSRARRRLEALFNLAGAARRQEWLKFHPADAVPRDRMAAAEPLNPACVRINAPEERSPGDTPDNPAAAESLHPASTATVPSPSAARPSACFGPRHFTDARHAAHGRKPSVVSVLHCLQSALRPPEAHRVRRRNRLKSRPSTLLKRPLHAELGFGLFLPYR